MKKLLIVVVTLCLVSFYSCDSKTVSSEDIAQTDEFRRYLKASDEIASPKFRNMKWPPPSILMKYSNPTDFLNSGEIEEGTVFYEYLQVQEEYVASNAALLERYGKRGLEIRKELSLFPTLNQILD